MGEGVNITASTGTSTSKLSIRLLIVFSAQCQVVILLFNFKCSPYFICWGCFFTLFCTDITLTYIYRLKFSQFGEYPPGG